MTNRILVLLVAVMLLVGMTACGQGEKDENATSPAKEEVSAEGNVPIESSADGAIESSEEQLHDDTEHLLGVYKLTETTENGTIVDVNVDFTIEFKGDGTAVLVYEDEVAEAEYTFDNENGTLEIINNEGEAVEFEVSDDAITYIDENIVMVFTYQNQQ